MSYTSASTSLHHNGKIAARRCNAVDGHFALTFFEDGEVFELSIFSNDAGMAVEMEAAINAVLAKHNRLEVRT
jgi:hypothetical protein